MIGRLDFNFFESSVLYKRKSIPLESEEKGWMRKFSGFWKRRSWYCRYVMKEVSNLYCNRRQASGGGEGVLPSRTALESS